MLLLVSLLVGLFVVGLFAVVAVAVAVVAVVAVVAIVAIVAIVALAADDTVAEPQIVVCRLCCLGRGVV